MPCYSIVKVPFDVRASDSEMQTALAAMNLSMSAVSKRDDGTWKVDRTVDQNELRRQLQRATTLATAQAQGYRVTGETRDKNNRIVIRLSD